MTTELRRINRNDLPGLISSEIAATITEDGWEILNRSMMNSTEMWIALDDEKVLGFWGLIAPSLLSDRAYIWLYSNPNLQEHSFVFVRHSQLALENALRSYPIIAGHCALSAERSQRWLRWLGAKFGEPQGLLIPFEIRESRWRRRLEV